MENLKNEPATNESVVSNSNAVQYLTHGTSAKPGNDRINDPLWYVDRFRAHREQSVREVVLSVVAVCEGLNTLEDGSEDFRRFMRGLADSKMMSQVEAAKAKRADMPMVSKFRMIYELREIILHPSIADKLCNGPSVLYEFALLAKHYMPDGEVTPEVVAEVSKKIGRHLDRLEGELTRKWVKGERERIGAIPARKAKAKLDKPEEQAVGDSPHSDLEDESDQDETEEEEEVVDEETLSIDQITSGELIAAVLLIVTESNEAKLCRATYMTGWHRIADNLAANSVAIIVAPLHALLEIIQTTGTFACNHCAHIYLLDEPGNLDLAKCNVLAVFERGNGGTVVEGVPSWNPDDTPISIAEQVLQGVPGRRLQIFADGPVEGWDALTFDDDYTPRLHPSPA